MADQQRHVDTKFTIQDQVSKSMERMGASVGRFAKRVDGALGNLGRLTSIAGGLGITLGGGATLMQAKEYLRQVDRLSAMTKTTANDTAGMMHAMQGAGVEIQEVKTTMYNMSRQQNEILRGNKEWIKQSKKFGVDLKQGPAKTFVQVAASLKEGKMSAAQMSQFLAMGEAEVGPMLQFLKQGPKEVERAFATGRKNMSHINEESIRQYREFEFSLQRVKASWTRITTVVVMKLAPVLTHMTDAIEANINSWVSGAQKFGNFLVDYMQQAVNVATALTKIMVVNQMLMKTTGEGIIGNIGRITKFATGGGIGKLFKDMAGGGSKENILSAVMGGGVRGKAMGGAARATSLIPKVGPILTKFLFGAVKLGPIVKMLLKLSLVGAVIGVVVNGIQRVLRNVDDIRQRIGTLLGKIWENVKGIGEELSKLFGPSSPFGKVIRWFGDKLVRAFEWILELVERITGFFRVLFRAIGDFIKNKGRGGFSLDLARDNIENDRREKLNKQLGSVVKTMRQLDSTEGALTAEQRKQFRSLEKQRRAIEKGLGRDITGKPFLDQWARLKARANTPDQVPQAQVNQDFRGSRFEIQQAFSEGFDPDRVAVAFANDLASLGERRLQSGLSPVFSVR